MADRVSYVYAVVPAGFDVEGAPEGLEDEPVRIVVEDRLGALVSELPAEEYTAERLPELTGELRWLGDRARAHDRVVTWASDAAPTVPLPMFTLFRDVAGVRSTLRSRAEQLQGALAHVSKGREYVVRVYRLDEMLVTAGVGRLSERIAALEKEAAAATPGQRYLLQRKLDEEKKSEARRVALEAAREIFETLRAHAADATTQPALTRADGGAVGAAILDAAFLVPTEDMTAFRTALTEKVERYEPAGFRVEFTGPWPAYHFARERVVDER